MPITFQVDLETLGGLGFRHPYNRTEGTNFKFTRSTYFPDHLLNNRTLKHGDTLTLSGQPALYMLNNYTQGDHAFLRYVSGEA